MSHHLSRCLCSNLGKWMLYRSETFFFSSFSFGSSQRDWILVFIMIFMKALKFKFAYLSEYALFSFSFCRKSQRSSSAGWCLQPCMWWMQVIQPVRTKQGFDDLALRSHETPLQHFGHFITYTSLDVLLLSELPQFFVAHSIFQWLDGRLSALLSWWDSPIAPHPKKGWENCGKKDLHSQQPHSGSLLILRGPKMCQGNVPCTMTPPGGWEGSMRSCCSC